MALIEQMQVFANTVVGKTYEQAGIKIRYRKDKNGNQSTITDLSKLIYAAADLPADRYLVFYDLEEDSSDDPNGTQKEKVKITKLLIKTVYERLEDQDEYIIARSETASHGSAIYRRVESL